MSDEVKKTETARDAEFETVLDRQLGRLLGGQASIDDCCSAEPVYAEDLRPLLLLAAAGQASLKPQSTPSGNETAAREKIMAHARSLGSPRISGVWRRLRPLSLATGLFLLLFAGTALAAGSAAPDSFLYPVKQKMESARTTLAIQDADQAKVEAGHAGSRLDELQKMIDEGKSEYTGSLLADYESHMSDASAHAAAAAAAGEDTSEIYALIGSVRDRHDAMMKSIGIDDGSDQNENSAGGQLPQDSAGSGQPLPEAPGGVPSENHDMEQGGSGDGNDSGHEGGSGGYEQPEDEGHSGGSGDSQSGDGGSNGSSHEEADHNDAPKQEMHGASPSHD